MISVRVRVKQLGLKSKEIMQGSEHDELNSLVCECNDVSVSV